MRRNVPIIYIIEDNGCYGLTKGQFSPTADVGSIAEERRRQRSAADRHLRAGDPAGRVIRGAVVLGGQETAPLDPQGVAEPPRNLPDRRDFPVRDVQRSRGVDQELRVREGPRRAARRGQLRAVLRGHFGRVRAGDDQGGAAARRVEAVSEESGRGLRSHRQAQRDAADSRHGAARRVRHRHPLRRARQGRLRHAPQHRGRAARHAAARARQARARSARRDHGEPR